MRLYRLVSSAYGLLPVDVRQKQAMKDAIYSRYGFLFRRSHNYHEWLKPKKHLVKLPPLGAPPTPTRSEWNELVERKRRSRPSPSPSGRPYIVVPVYKGRSETLVCLYSVLDADPHADLLVIDDQSPEPALSASLRWLSEQGLIALERNDENLGFALTVNRGMAAHPERDVVLLNSDTRVYGDWLARLSAAAYEAADASGDEVGTVTPLTNNGDLASYPNWMADNPIELELDHEELDALAAEVNRGIYVDVPTGVGFCLYIRRDCLDAIGLFDESFAAGYGEENDFCLRAAKAGWRSTVATNVFVTHWGKVSFGNSAKQKQEKALARIGRRFPTYEADIHRFVAGDPMSAARLRLDLARIRRSAPHDEPARSVLMVLHNWGGGVEEHVREMSRALEEEGVNVYRLLPSSDPSAPAVTLRGPTLKHSPEGLPNAECISMNPQREELIDAMRILGIDHVHIHHTGGFGIFATDWLQSIPRELGCSYDLTLHDYAAICPRLHLNRPDGSYCGEPELNECERCMALNSGPQGYHPVWKWREGWTPLINGARRVFCPSADVAERTARYFPKARYALRPHPEPEFGVEYKMRRREREPEDVLRVAVPGAIGEQKGFDLVLACARDARKRKLPIEYRVVGYTMADDRAAAAGVKVLGRYEAERADRVLAESECHLALLPSLTPETYCFTLSSAFRVGLLPVVFDMGALAERVRDAGFGEVLPVDWMREAAKVNDHLLALRIARPPEDFDRLLAEQRYTSFLGDYYEF